jgi:hypothetical protein
MSLKGNKSCRLFCTVLSFICVAFHVAMFTRLLALIEACPKAIPRALAPTCRWIHRCVLQHRTWAFSQEMHISPKRASDDTPSSIHMECRRATSLVHYPFWLRAPRQGPRSWAVAPSSRQPYCRPKLKQLRKPRNGRPIATRDDHPNPRTTRTPEQVVPQASYQGTQTKAHVIKRRSLPCRWPGPCLQSIKRRKTRTGFYKVKELQ